MWITTSWRRFLAYEIGHLLFFAALFATLSLAHVANALRASVILFLGAQTFLIAAFLVGNISGRRP